MNDISKLIDYLRQLVRSRFYGKVIISFKDGGITTIKTERTVKISELDVPETNKIK